MRLNDWTDAQLIPLAARAGPHREAAFELLVRRYAPGLHRLASGLVGAGSADDVLQEVFMSVYRSLAGFRGDAPFGAWVHRITVNACNKALAARRSLALDEVAEVTTLLTPVRATEQDALRETLARAMAGLPPEQREAVALRELSGLDYAEIAAVTGVSLGTVKSRINRGRAALRERLSASGYVPDAPPVPDLPTVKEKL
ncbi:RNA polymerase sigma-70 factor, ECF subfamily [Deinococcus reticulitermitis]|uniref:RNA polymerase sigma-70 factor, ECF subfamily n=1 Tax=Deinococcus reticulitermitis TaxID=856736 RepID=A0A1H6Y3A1_9DEIO|nr:RNA polymerase sigma-70 factor, ECF subfamily [Deinococcus reticulitermitis]